VNERHLSQHRSNAKTHGNDEWEVFANSCDRSRFFYIPLPCNQTSHLTLKEEIS
jgi:hypothetical protein